MVKQASRKRAGGGGGGGGRSGRGGEALCISTTVKLCAFLPRFRLETCLLSNQSKPLLGLHQHHFILQNISEAKGGAQHNITTRAGDRHSFPQHQSRGETLGASGRPRGGYTVNTAIYNQSRDEKIKNNGFMTEGRSFL